MGMSDEPRCAVTELLVDYCAHCRPTESSLVPQPPAGPVVVARYDGFCDPCGQHYWTGDDIRGTDDGWVHADCAPSDTTTLEVNP